MALKYNLSTCSQLLYASQFPTNQDFRKAKSSKLLAMNQAIKHAQSNHHQMKVQGT